MPSCIWLLFIVWVIWSGGIIHVFFNFFFYKEVDQIRNFWNKSSLFLNVQVHLKRRKICLIDLFLYPVNKRPTIEDPQNPMTMVSHAASRCQCWCAQHRLLVWLMLWLTAWGWRLLPMASFIFLSLSGVTWPRWGVLTYRHTDRQTDSSNRPTKKKKPLRFLLWQRSFKNKFRARQYARLIIVVEV